MRKIQNANALLCRVCAVGCSQLRCFFVIICVIIDLFCDEFVLKIQLDHMMVRYIKSTCDLK